MSNTDQILLSLVRYAIQKDNSETIALKTVDWDELILQSQKQSIPALVSDGLHKCLASQNENPFENWTSIQKERLLKWEGLKLQLERLYEKHVVVITTLARLYAKQNMRMMVLKGYGLSLDWPTPSHRALGDLDIYNWGKWQEADALISKECGIKVDDGHEHHTIFRFEGVSVENHYDFINTKAHRDAPAIEAHLKELAKNDAKKIEINRTEIYIPSADFNAIFLMRHMGQHFAGEHMNLRQVLDWGFFVSAHSKEIDWTSTIDFLKEIGLFVFFNQINAICVDYLGFSEESFPTINRNEYLENRILADILHPEFAEHKPANGLIPIIVFKLRRWWHNRWKHPLVYKEWLLPMFLTLLWSHLRRYKTIKD